MAMAPNAFFMAHFSRASVHWIPFLAQLSFLFHFHWTNAYTDAGVELVFGELSTSRVTVLWQCARQQTAYRHT